MEVFIKKAVFKFPVFIDGQLADTVMLTQKSTVETVYVLGNKNRKPDDYLRVKIDVDKIHEILDKEKAEREAKEKSKSE